MRRALVHELAGEFDPTAQNLEERGIGLIGRRCTRRSSGTTRQAVADRSEGAVAEIISRLPVRYTYDNRYFNDTWEGLPTDGYTAWLERMADHPNIEVKLSTDYFDESQPLNKKATVGQVPSSTPVRSTGTSTTPRASCRGGRSTSRRRCSRSATSRARA
jgi:UDP-galactopyranose mutase